MFHMVELCEKIVHCTKNQNLRRILVPTCKFQDLEGHSTEHFDLKGSLAI